ncbi:Endothelin-converting enzyme 2 [Biomphalaria glabrata]|nr:FMRFamide receptor-like [Biomphalaria glabrata]
MSSELSIYYVNVDLNYQTSDFENNSVYLFDLINLSILTTILCLLGIVSNILNLIVFYKQTITTVAISLIALSITDLINVILMEWVSISSYPSLLTLNDLIIFPRDVSYMTGGFPHGCMSRITAWITVYMTAERCLCVALPLRVKFLITPRRTLVAMFFIYAFNLLPLVPLYLSSGLGWKYSTVRNQSLIGRVYTADLSYLENIGYFISTVLMMVAFIAVIFLTVLLTVQLHKMTKWRNKNSAVKDGLKNITAKEKVALRTVLVIACVLVITFIPSFTFCWIFFVVPDFRPDGRLKDAFFVIASFSFVFDSLNASTNTVWYFKMNSNYRKTFHRLFLKSLNQK